MLDIIVYMVRTPCGTPQRKSGIASLHLKSMHMKLIVARLEGNVIAGNNRYL